jgi:hypothetical protein
MSDTYVHAVEGRCKSLGGQVVRCQRMLVEWGCEGIYTRIIIKHRWKSTTALSILEVFDFYTPWTRLMNGEKSPSRSSSGGKVLALWALVSLVLLYATAQEIPKLKSGYYVTRGIAPS